MPAVSQAPSPVGRRRSTAISSPSECSACRRVEGHSPRASRRKSTPNGAFSGLFALLANVSVDDGGFFVFGDRPCQTLLVTDALQLLERLLEAGSDRKTG